MRHGYAHKSFLIGSSVRDAGTFSAYLIYGDGGILQLCKLWSVESDQDEVRWPRDEVGWAQTQGQDDEGKRLIDNSCEEVGQEYHIYI